MSGIHHLDVECGDIILFSRPCWRMDVFSALVCAAAKGAALSEWDHVGIVVEDIRSPTTDVTGTASTITDNADNEISTADHGKQLYLVEANARGVTIRPLRERLQKSRASQIAVRKLIGHLSPEMKQYLWERSHERNGSFYNNSLGHLSLAMIGSYVDPNTQQSHYQGRLLDVIEHQSMVDHELYYRNVHHATLHDHFIREEPGRPLITQLLLLRHQQLQNKIETMSFQVNSSAPLLTAAAVPTPGTVYSAVSDDSADPSGAWDGKGFTSIVPTIGGAAPVEPTEVPQINKAAEPYLNHSTNMAELQTLWSSGKVMNNAKAASEKRYFCSQLVAELLQELGVLHPDRDSNSFIPADFSSSARLSSLHLQHTQRRQSHPNSESQSRTRGRNPFHHRFHLTPDLPIRSADVEFRFNDEDYDADANDVAKVSDELFRSGSDSLDGHNRHFLLGMDPGLLSLHIQRKGTRSSTISTGAQNKKASSAAADAAVGVIIGELRLGRHNVIPAAILQQWRAWLDEHPLHCLEVRGELDAVLGAPSIPATTLTLSNDDAAGPQSGSGTGTSTGTGTRSIRRRGSTSSRLMLQRTVGHMHNVRIVGDRSALLLNAGGENQPVELLPLNRNPSSSPTRPECIPGVEADHSVVSISNILGELGSSTSSGHSADTRYGDRGVGSALHLRAATPTTIRLVQYTHHSITPADTAERADNIDNVDTRATEASSSSIASPALSDTASPATVDGNATIRAGNVTEQNSAKHTTTSKQHPHSRELQQFLTEWNVAPQVWLQLLSAINEVVIANISDDTLPSLEASSSLTAGGDPAAPAAPAAPAVPFKSSSVSSLVSSSPSTSDVTPSAGANFGACSTSSPALGSFPPSSSSSSSYSAAAAILSPTFIKLFSDPQYSVPVGRCTTPGLFGTAEPDSSTRGIAAPQTSAPDQTQTHQLLHRWTHLAAAIARLQSSAATISSDRTDDFTVDADKQGALVNLPLLCAVDELLLERRFALAEELLCSYACAGVALDSSSASTSSSSSGASRSASGSGEARDMGAIRNFARGAIQGLRLFYADVAATASDHLTTSINHQHRQNKLGETVAEYPTVESSAILLPFSSSPSTVFNLELQAKGIYSRLLLGVFGDNKVFLVYLMLSSAGEPTGLLGQLPGRVQVTPLLIY